MNTTTVIVSIVALLGGLTAGLAIQNDEVDVDVEEVRSQVRGHMMSENPPAQDFVSLRPGITELPEQTLSQAEIDGLLLMREEEKLARDVYQTLYDQWGLRIFTNIAQSEQTHTEAVRELLVKYDLEDPVIDDSIGVFANSELQKLYNGLIAQGSASEVEALTVGATIEDLDIKDLMDLSLETDNEDILLVYSNLTRGSRNHLRAFTRQLDTRGETYGTQYISSNTYQEILDSEQETGKQGGGNGHPGQGGRGWGGGMGKR